MKITKAIVYYEKSYKIVADEYEVTGKGRNYGDAVEDFLVNYGKIKDKVEPTEWFFFFDTASFLRVLGQKISIKGISNITGISAGVLYHYISGKTKPSKKATEKIRMGIKLFGRNIVDTELI